MKKGLLLCLMLLAGCGAAPPDAPPQKWHDADVRIETEPSPPKIGMNETRILVSKKWGKAPKGIMVSVRTNEQDPWHQAFPDGDLGIFHTAIDTRRGTVVEVKISKENPGGNEDTVLKFPLSMH